METSQETHGSSHTAVLGNDGAGPSNTTQTSFNQWQLQLQAEITKKEAVERHLKHVEDELNHVKGLVATIQQNQPPPSQNVEQNQPPPSQNVQQNHPPSSQNVEQNQPPVQTQLPIQTPIVDLPSSPSPLKVYKKGKSAKKKANAAMVDLASSPSKRDNEGEAAAAVLDLASSPSKRDNEGEAAAAVVDLVSSPSNGSTTVRNTMTKIRAQKNLMRVPPQSKPVNVEVCVLFNNKVLK
jgi:hypothetical protein